MGCIRVWRRIGARGWQAVLIFLSCLVPYLAAAQQTSPNQPPSPPQGWLASFQIKKGFRLELAASEALVSSPVAMAFDENGRLFVAEQRDYPNQQEKTPHLGRIRLVEDTDGDGVFDSSTVYADNLAWPSAVACFDGGLFVASTPDILFLRDVNGDGVADARRIVFTGFGATNTASFEKLINSFRWGLDNRIHGLTAGLESSVAAAGSAGEHVALQNEDFSFEPRTLSLMADAGPAQSGMTFDLYGRRFTSDYSRPLQLTLLDWRYPKRNPFLPAPQSCVPVLSSAAPVFPFMERPPAPARNSAGNRTPAPAPIRTWMTQARGLAIYRGNAFPAAYANNAFICDPEAR